MNRSKSAWNQTEKAPGKMTAAIISHFHQGVWLRIFLVGAFRHHLGNRLPLNTNIQAT